MSLLLYELVPLRTSQELGDFATAFVLAHRYGDLSNARFNLDAMSTTKYFVADHPMVVTSVFVNNTVTQGWSYTTESDGKGNTWTVVNLSNATISGDVVSACGIGKLNPDTGELLTNPAEIIEDIERICGNETLGWGQLRAEAAAAGIVLAGCITAVQSIRAQIDEVTGSAGAIWSLGISRLYPTDTVTGLLKVLEKSVVSAVVPSADLTDTADILKLSYDFNYATGSPQRYIQFEASPKRYNGIEFDLTLPWLRQSANAELIGRRLLQRLAGKRVDVAFNSTDPVIEGDWVKLVSVPEWSFQSYGDPIIMVTESDTTPGDNEIACIGETVIEYPQIVITAHTIAIPSTTDGGADVVYQNGVATFTFTIPGGGPAKGARCSVDGGAPKTTDDQGKVAFQLAVGPHTVAVEAVGYTPMQFTVDLEN